MNPLEQAEALYDDIERVNPDIMTISVERDVLVYILSDYLSHGSNVEQLNQKIANLEGDVEELRAKERRIVSAAREVVDRRSLDGKVSKRAVRALEQEL